MKVLSLLALAALMAAGTAQAQSTPINQWQIIEGRGLTDDVVYLGMTRKAAVAVSRECKGKVSTCSFQPQAGSPTPIDTPVVTLTFDAKNKVSRIVINQNFRDIQWPTTAGATDAMSITQVQALYPGSSIAPLGPFDYALTASKQGYTFNEYNEGSDGFERRLVTHVLTKPRR
ncbi:hypothetical protein [Ideonella sp.]|jgi:hypothetical protein|uniref:hypothetical protein n=1 Tax=Ideonella sp. TaxID=1929293 RepID=UPI0037C1031C